MINLCSLLLLSDENWAVSVLLVFCFIMYVFCFIMYHSFSTARKYAAQTKTKCIITLMLRKPQAAAVFTTACSSHWLSPEKKGE